MKKVFKLALFTAAIACVCMAVSGCGKEKFNITQHMTPEYSGYDGYGTVTFAGTYDWVDDIMDWYGDSITDSQRRSSERELRDVVKFEFEPKEGLSNGDTVTVTAKVGKAADDYAFILEGREATFTVEGLEPIKEVDPFEEIEVFFEGKSPNGTAKMNNNSGDYSVYYEMDKNSGLENGDVVTITAAPAYGINEDSYAKQYGKKFSVTEKTYTVEGLASYPKTIDEISEDMYNKMAKQAEDGIKSHCSGWDEGNSLGKLEFLGNYMLSVKDGFSANPSNRIYYVYKATANMTGMYEEDYANGDSSIKTGTDEFYTYVYFYEILNLPDGTTSVDLSRSEMCSNRVDSVYGHSSFFGATAYKFNGYKDLDSMFNDCVTQNIEKYDYINTVE